MSPGTRRPTTSRRRSSATVAAIEQLRAAIRQGGRLERDRADRGRDRHGEGARRAGDPSKRATEARGPFVAVNCAEIAESSVRKRALRPHARRVHGSDRGPQGPSRERSRRHVAPRRDGGSRARAAGEASARAAEPRVQAGRHQSRFIRFDARVIAASNQEIERLVQQKRFRADLFFRLDVLRLRVPPLRERREDVPRLVEHAMRRFNRSERHALRCVFRPRPTRH